jgi:3-hydroxyisobutyrate dehydrogenase-like beta-hydroxyacid dehydrogenase
MPAGRPDIYKDARPFKKGQSGNPKGRPKLPDLSEAIARVLSEEKDGLTALDAILAALRAKAAKGDVRAAQELLDRGFGKSKQFIDHTTTGEKITGFTLEVIHKNEAND